MRYQTIQEEHAYPYSFLYVHNMSTYNIEQQQTHNTTEDVLGNVDETPVVNDKSVVRRENCLKCSISGRESPFSGFRA
jgi:hypothetical protein